MARVSWRRKDLEFVRPSLDSIPAVVSTNCHHPAPIPHDTEALAARRVISSSWQVCASSTGGLHVKQGHQLKNTFPSKCVHVGLDTWESDLCKKRVTSLARVIWGHLSSSLSTFWPRKDNLKRHLEEEAQGGETSLWIAGEERRGCHGNTQWSHKCPRLRHRDLGEEQEIYSKSTF